MLNSSIKMSLSLINSSYEFRIIYKILVVIEVLVNKLDYCCCGMQTHGVCAMRGMSDGTTSRMLPSGNTRLRRHKNISRNAAEISVNVELSKLNVSHAKLGYITFFSLNSPRETFLRIRNSLLNFTRTSRKSVLPLKGK